MNAKMPLGKGTAKGSTKRVVKTWKRGLLRATAVSREDGWLCGNDGRFSDDSKSEDTTRCFQLFIFELLLNYNVRRILRYHRKLQYTTTVIATALCFFMMFAIVVLHCLLFDCMNVPKTTFVVLHDPSPLSVPFLCIILCFFTLRAAFLSRPVR